MQLQTGTTTDGSHCKWVTLQTADTASGCHYRRVKLQTGATTIECHYRRVALQAGTTTNADGCHCNNTGERGLLMKKFPSEFLSLIFCLSVVIKAPVYRGGSGGYSSGELWEYGEGRG